MSSRWFPAGTARTSETLMVPSLSRQAESWPVFSPRRELHMHALHVLARAVSLDLQIEPDQGEGDRDRLGVLAGALRRMGVDDVLMNE
jgi:hypothetical protein